MKTKHTPTPWKIGQSTNGEIAIRIGEGTLDDDCVAVVCDLLEGEAEANAQFIVQACNHHEELVEALTYYVDAHERHKLSMPETNENDGKTWLRTLEIAKSLLTKLKG